MPAARLLLAAAAGLTGVAVGWAAASGRVLIVAWMAILVAAANGYSKAHSP